MPIEKEPNRSAAEYVKFSRDRSKLAVARYSDHIEMWTVSNGECQWKTKSNLHVGYLFHLAFSADDSKLACKNDDKMIVLDAESGEECNSEDTFEFTEVYSAYVS